MCSLPVCIWIFAEFSTIRMYDECREHTNTLPSSYHTPSNDNLYCRSLINLPILDTSIHLYINISNYIAIAVCIASTPVESFLVFFFSSFRSLFSFSFFFFDWPMALCTQSEYCVSFLFQIDSIRWIAETKKKRTLNNEFIIIIYYYLLFYRIVCDTKEAK